MAMFSSIIEDEIKEGKSELIVVLEVDLEMVLYFLSLSLSLSCRQRL